MNDLTTEDVTTMFIWGAIGGALPTLGRIAGTFGANFDAPFPAISGVLTAVILYAFIGAVVARAVGNSDMKQSLFAGIAAPAIVVSVLAGAADAPRRNALTGSASFISSAVAQVVPAEGGKTVTFNPVIRGNLPLSDKLTVSADVKVTPTATKRMPVGTFRIEPGNPVEIEVPANATSLYVEGNKIDLQRGTSIYDLKVTPTTTFIGDLIWALGGRRKFEIGKVDVAPQKEAP